LQPLSIGTKNDHIQLDAEVEVQ